MKCIVYGALFRRKSAFAVFAMFKHEVFQSRFLSMGYTYPKGLIPEPAVFRLRLKTRRGRFASPPPPNWWMLICLRLILYNNIIIQQSLDNILTTKCWHFFTTSHKEKIVVSQHYKYQHLQSARIFFRCFALPAAHRTRPQTSIAFFFISFPATFDGLHKDASFCDAS